MTGWDSAADLGKDPAEIPDPASIDVPDELKLKLIERLRRMATQPANQLLQTALASFPADGSPKVKQGLERAIKGYSATGEESE